MHIYKESIPEGLYDFRAWCGVEVDGLTRSYLSIDTAVKALSLKRGAFPCQDCLRLIYNIIKQGVIDEKD